MDCELVKDFLPFGPSIQNNTIKTVIVKHSCLNFPQIYYFTRKNASWQYVKDALFPCSSFHFKLSKGHLFSFLVGAPQRVRCLSKTCETPDLVPNCPFHVQRSPKCIAASHTAFPEVLVLLWPSNCSCH